MTRKKSNIVSIVCLLMSLCMAAGLFCIILEKYGYLLCYLEQRQMFIYSGAYFLDICCRAGGFTTYLANFLTQFMCTPAAAAAVATLCVVISAAFICVACRRFKWCGLWMFPVSILVCSLPLLLLCQSFGFEVVAVMLAGTGLAAILSLLTLRTKWLKLAVISPALVAFSLMFIPATYRSDDGGKKQNLRYYELEYLTNHGRWDEIISLTGKNPRNYTELNFLNLALAEKGLLADKLLFYPQRGPQSLLNFNHQRDELSMMTLAHILYQAGDYAGAQSMAFSVAVDRNHTFRHPYMLRIVRDVDAIRGSELTVSKYDALFSKTLNYRKWADEPKVSEAERKSFEVKDFFSLYYTPFEDLTAILDAAPDNYIASQYAEAFAVLTKDVKMMRTYVERYFNTPAMNRKLSRPMAEALLFYADYYGSIDREFAASHGMGEEEYKYMKELDYEWCLKYGVTAEVAEDFAAFKDVFDNYGTGAPSSTYYRFRNTFWYYLLFVKI